MANRAGGSTFSVLGTDIVVTGNIQAQVDLHIDGKIEGDISCASLVLGETSEVTGAIRAQSARIAGQVNGSIDAGELIIDRTARISGDVCYESITIEQGGQVDGKFMHRGAARGKVLPAGESHPATLDLAEAGLIQS